MGLNVTYVGLEEILDWEGFREKVLAWGLPSSSQLLTEPFRDLLANNPNGCAADPGVFLGLVDGRIACHIALVPDVLCVGGEELRWFWGQSFLTTAEARGRGIGTAVVKEMLRVVGAMGACYGAFAMSPSSRRVWAKCGMVDLGEFDRWVLPCDIRPFVDRFVPRAFPAGLARRLGNLGLTCFRARNRAAARRQLDTRYQCGKVTEFPHELPSRDFSIPLSVCMRNGARELNWKLAAAPGRSSGQKKYRCHVVRRRDSGTLEGSFVLRDRVLDGPRVAPYRDVRISTLMDWSFISTTESMRAVLGYAVSESLGRTEVMEVVSSVPSVSRELRKWGFLRKGGMALCYKAPCLLPQARKEWWISAGESDAFFM